MDAVLAFHAIDDTPTPLTFPRGDLVALLDRLERDRVSVVGLDELLSPPARPGHRVALTFDDGLRSAHRQALPLLRDRGLTALVYVVSGFAGKTNRWPSQPAWVPELPLMSWDELCEWQAAGLGIGDHSSSHLPARGLAATDYAAELDASRDRIRQRLGTEPRHFAYPYGIHDAAAVEAVRGRYRSAVTARMGYVQGRPDPHLVPRIDAYYLRGRWARTGLFSPLTRAWLGGRRLLRAVRERVHPVR